jgi:aryl-alcohol dehydrogenase-like predicted oxidoreductase
MEYRFLGRTGLRASVMGLGCGGHSRLGLATGRSEENAIAVVRDALTLGVNLIDTAEAYGTETVVGRALNGVSRESVILSTKISPSREGQVIPAAQFRERAEACLQRLQTDYVDILHLHGVPVKGYDEAVSELVPAMQQLRTEGKIRFLGITEAFASDPQHAMLQRALQDDCWDVMMIGFNLLNQSARERALRHTQAKGIGTLCMFAVRRALSRPEALSELLRDLHAQGLLEGEAFDPQNPLNIFGKDHSAAALTGIAYRFCRDEPGLDVILSGTGDPAHLRENADALLGPPLPAEQVEAWKRLFRRVDSVSGN